MLRARTARLTFCLLLAVCAVALGALSVQRKVASFQPLGFTAVPSGGLLSVLQVDDPGTGLRPHDRILLVEGLEASWGSGLDSLLKRQPESALAVLRGDQVLSVRYHRPPFAPDIAYLVLALIGCAYLLIGLYTLLRQGGSQEFLFCLWCLVSAALYLLTPVPPLDSIYRVVYTIDQLCRILLPGITLHLFLVFPSRLPIVGGNPAALEGKAGQAPRRPALSRRISFVYLPAAVLLALHLDLILWNGRWLFGRVTAGALIALDRLDLLHLASFALAALGVLGYRLAHCQGWEQRRQLQWMAFGLAGGYLPFLILYVTPFVLGWRESTLVAALGVLPLALVPLSFAYAILRYRLWDIEVIARDIISSTLTLFLGIICFSLINLAITRGISADFTLARNLLSFAAGLGIAGLLVPTRHSLSSAFERLQYRGTFRKRRALLGLGRDLLHERDLGRLCVSLLERLRSGMALERANLYLVQGGSLIATQAEPGLPAVLPVGEVESELWQDGFRRLFGVELPSGAPSPLQRMFVAGYRYAFPLTVRGRGIGLALASFRRDQTPLNSDDIALVRQLLIQAALAIENAQLLYQLQLQLEEMKSLKRYSDGIFESSPAGIAVLDEELRLVSVNHAFARLVGQGRAELVGRALGEVLAAPELPLPSAAPVEIIFTDPGGQVRNLQISLADFAADEGEKRAELRILVVHDITERVLMENALKEKDRLAALGMLAAGVAHEVNTPITGISSYAQMLLADTAESDPHYSILKKVERQTFRAARIVNNLLEFARDRQKERRPVALEPLLVECIELLGERIERRRIEVLWDLPSRSRAQPEAPRGGTGAPELRPAPPARPILIMGCDGELQQVFTNLFGNALDAMAGMERGVLGISVAAGERNVAVRVHDTGPGIPADAVATVFKPFFSTKLHRGGTGLGLSISHEIVQRHGGSLSLVSTPGEGACFVVELPRYIEIESLHEHPDR